MSASIVFEIPACSVRGCCATVHGYAGRRVPHCQAHGQVVRNLAHRVRTARDVGFRLHPALVLARGGTISAPAAIIKIASAGLVSAMVEARQSGCSTGDLERIIEAAWGLAELDA